MCGSPVDPRAPAGDPRAGWVAVFSNIAGAGGAGQNSQNPQPGTFGNTGEFFFFFLNTGEIAILHYRPFFSLFFCVCIKPGRRTLSQSYCTQSSHSRSYGLNSHITCVHLTFHSIYSVEPQPVVTVQTQRCRAGGGSSQRTYLRSTCGCTDASPPLRSSSHGCN